MLGDRAVNAENDRLGLCRQMRYTHRAFHTLDSDFRTVNNFGHRSSRLVRLALKLGWGALTVQTFVLEAPFERHIFRNVAFAIVARLVAERSLDDQFAG